MTLVLVMGIGWNVREYLPRFGLALLGLLSALALSIVLNQTMPDRITRVVRAWGQKSMQIYIVHVLAASGLRIVLVHLAMLTNPWPHVTLQSLAGVIVPLWFDSFLNFIRFPYAFSLRPPVAAVRGSQS
ncbi:MAG: hypothetical protein IT323_15380, partial [Anaerolineae bacterium]|nr:hypothetical protein [Anaerolineae bacterium]